jgi:hypothetical protein
MKATELTIEREGHGPTKVLCEGTDLAKIMSIKRIDISISPDGGIEVDMQCRVDRLHMKGEVSLDFTPEK